MTITMSAATYWWIVHALCFASGVLIGAALSWRLWVPKYDRLSTIARRWGEERALLSYALFLAESDSDTSARTGARALPPAWIEADVAKMVSAVHVRKIHVVIQAGDPRVVAKNLGETC